MWKAPEEVRLRRASDWLVKNVPELWHAAEHRNPIGAYTTPLDGGPVASLPEPQRGYYEATIERLGREFGLETLAQLIPELFFFPADGLYREQSSDGRLDWWVPRWIAHHALRMWLQDTVPDYAVELAAARLRSMVRNGLAVHEVTPTTFGALEFFLPPNASACEALLITWNGRPAADAAIRELLDGEWDMPLVIPPSIRECWEARGQVHLVQEYEGRSTYAYFHLSSMFHQVDFRTFPMTLPAA